ncbi:RagB/SusD family nutrient uptake outer membrane protein [Niabella sp. CC-SYL272]|uniref:RagB/SusD family nutrient uptake outer membrane protein n=1 Tax=Niabella agricola TaxID=2891571 RepID=UPI001F3DDCFB|nr:RagB/SusD family nutrient uptake outer membrane protein [Niabella agricola]MCF3111791.1 RagB/SusD family nutrient uptake outer membrane protein [Niabella agricola]
MNKLIGTITMTCLVLVMVCGFGGCKRFLNVNPPLALSGNNFWKTTDDFDQYMAGLYAKFRRKTMGQSGPGLDCCDVQFFPAVGDFRCAPVAGVDATGRHYITLAANNDLKTLTGSYNNNYWVGTFAKITEWGPFFDIIAGCNIMVDAVNKDKDVLRKDKKDQFLGEAVFLRNLIYFMMARLYGDIPYYTNAFNRNPEPRQAMVPVLQKCLADLGTVVNNMPWTYVDPVDKGARAMRGSALDLMMNINMWCAGFDKENKEKYWQQTDSLGEVLLTQNNGAYQLMPITQMHEVFKGGTPESLFEIRQNLNTGERFGLFASFADNVLTAPYKPNGTTRTYAGYNPAFMQQLFPTNKNDLRWTLFFYQPQGNTDPHRLQCIKFLNIYAVPGEDVNPDDCQMIFRLPDAILLQAEACASLGGAKTQKAITLLDMVRKRSGADLYVEGETPGLDLSDAIYYERCKELFGEGYYYFDLVRTGRILDPKFCYHPISENDFALGAWTWPISSSALTQNPGMQLNNYWQ